MNGNLNVGAKLRGGRVATPSGVDPWDRDGLYAESECHEVAMKRIAVWGLSVLGAPSLVCGQARSWEGWEMHPMWGMWGAWGVLMMVFMFVFWGLVIVGLVLGIRWLVRQDRGARSPDAALDVLRQRYARGEIDREEFLAKKRDL